MIKSLFLFFFSYGITQNTHTNNTLGQEEKYLTIENKGIIEEPLRHLIGNRVYGCDDCQLVCPWNKYAKLSTLEEFNVKNGLDDVSLINLFKWNEVQFMHNHVGSPILRIGYERWLRNIAIGLGNSANKKKEYGSVNNGAVSEIKKTLVTRLNENKPILRPHLDWAIAQCVTQVDEM